MSLTLLNTQNISKIKIKDWNTKLASIYNWTMTITKPKKPTANFTIVFKPKLLGFEHLYSEHNIDDVFLKQFGFNKDILINYIYTNFANYLINVNRTIINKNKEQLKNVKNILLPNNKYVPNAVKERKEKLKKQHGLS